MYHLHRDPLERQRGDGAAWQHQPVVGGYRLADTVPFPERRSTHEIDRNDEKAVAERTAQPTIATLFAGAVLVIVPRRQFCAARPRTRRKQKLRSSLVSGFREATVLTSSSHPIASRFSS